MDSDENPMASRPGAAASRPGLLDVTTIYHEPAAPEYPRGREILDRFPAAERVVVPSHWNIPGLHGNSGAAEDWLRIKKAVLVHLSNRYSGEDRLGRLAEMRQVFPAASFPSHWG